MAQNYRNQNESGRWQDYPRSSNRDSGSRDRYETGNERRFRPDWEERFAGSGHQDESFEGDRSYSAGGYPEEFGYRRDQNNERDRGGYQRYGSQESHDERPGGSYYDRPYGDRPYGRQGRNNDYGSRDFGPGQPSGYQGGSNQGGSMRSQGQRPDFNREQGYRGDELNRGRDDYYGSSLHGGSSNYYGSQGAFGNTSGSMLVRSGSERFGQPGQQQSHRGRGPKGYERSDERLREMVCERLTDDPSIDASEISIEVTNKVVKLTGTVDDRRTKYLVEDVIEQVGGVRDIDNQLRVQQQHGQHGQSQTGQPSQFGSSNENSRNINVGQSGNVGQSSNVGQSTPPSPSKRN